MAKRICRRRSCFDARLQRSAPDEVVVECIPMPSTRASDSWRMVSMCLVDPSSDSRPWPGEWSDQGNNLADGRLACLAGRATLGSCLNEASLRYGWRGGAAAQARTIDLPDRGQSTTCLLCSPWGPCLERLLSRHVLFSRASDTTEEEVEEFTRA